MTARRAASPVRGQGCAVERIGLSRLARDMFRHTAEALMIEAHLHASTAATTSGLSGFDAIAFIDHCRP